MHASIPTQNTNTPGSHHNLMLRHRGKLLVADGAISNELYCTWYMIELGGLFATLPNYSLRVQILAEIIHESPGDFHVCY